MNNDLNHAASHLVKGQLQRIQDGLGTRVLALRGRLWLTQEGDLRDIILDPGEDFLIDHQGASYLSALADSSFVLLCNSKLRPQPPVPLHSRQPLALRWAARWE